MSRKIQISADKIRVEISNEDETCKNIVNVEEDGKYRITFAAWFKRLDNDSLVFRIAEEEYYRYIPIELIEDIQEVDE